MKTKRRSGELRPRRAGSKPFEPDPKAAFDRVMQLMAIPGTSGQEAGVAQFIASQLRRAGAAASAIRSDHAHRRSPLGGQVGNLVFCLEGTRRGPRRMLSAHMDTVPLCVGCKPIRRGGRVYSACKHTALGADNRAGCAVTLTAALEILQNKLPHPPLTFLWFVQEEVGLMGSHFANLSLLGRPKLAFNWDGGSPEKLTIGATGAYRLIVDIEGRASHAGGAPEYGVSAITIAARAIAELDQQGWLGQVCRNGRRGTSNVGIFEAGAATNVITDRAALKAEARSHDPEFRRQIVQAITQSFRKAARETRNVDGKHGKVRLISRLDYEAYQLSTSEPCVLVAERAVAAVGAKPLRAISNGGLDANWLTARGIPAVSLGCGQRNVHTVSEQLDLAMYQNACRIALRLGTATENETA